MYSFQKNLIATAAAVCLTVPLVAASAAMADNGPGPLVGAVPTEPSRTTAEFNVEQQELSKFLTDRNIENTLQPEESDSSLVNAVFDVENAAAWDAVNAFYDQKYPASPESATGTAAEAQRLVDYLIGKGFAASVQVDGNGLSYASYDGENQATSDAVEDFWWEASPLPQDVIDADNAESTKFVEFLKAKGIEATLTADRHGVLMVGLNWDDQATHQAAMEYYAENPGILVGGE